MLQGESVARGFQNLVHYLHSKLPSTHIVIMAILPKVPSIACSMQISGMLLLLTLGHVLLCVF